MRTITLSLSSIILVALPVVSLCGDTQNEHEAVFQQARSHLTGGDGVKRDPAKSFELMKQAADAGHPGALGGLGFFYSKGLVVEQNDTQAAEWFRRGAEAGSASAMLNYGTVLMQGKGVAYSLEDGLEWIRKAADAGSAEACLRWGNILFFGEHGIGKDAGKAYPYLLKAAESGNPSAQNSVGIMFETGDGVAQDQERAIEWFRKAAEKNHSKGQFNLGRMMAPHNPGPHRVEALMWLMLAKDAGEIAADKMLIEFDYASHKEDLDSARARANEFKAKNPKPSLLRR